jgi:hypothetical protein
MGSQLSRSVWGLDTPRGDWMAAAACLRYDPDLWSTEDMFPYALHQCLSHCPVLSECRAWAAPRQWVGVVVAGRAFVGSGSELRKRVPPTSTWLCLTCRPGELGPISVRAGTPAVPVCGTRRAYDRHLRRGEDVDEVCAAASRRRKREQRAERRRAEQTSTPADVELEPVDPSGVLDPGGGAVARFGVRSGLTHI